MHLYGQQFGGVLEKILLLPRCLVKMEKKKKFLKISFFFSKMFSEIKMQAATDWSRDLKNIKHLDFFQTKYFNAIFKNYIFPRFLKIICRTRKNHCMRLTLCKH